MEFIKWSDQEKVGIGVIDSQHEELVNIINNLYSGIGTKIKNEKELTRGLLEKMKIHFDTEEYFMKQYGDPNYISHKLEHDRCLNKTSRTTEDIFESNKGINVEFLNSFKTWLFNHLEFKDRKCAAYLRTKGLN